MLSAIEQGHAYVRDVATINGHNCMILPGNMCRCSYCDFYIYSGKNVSPIVATPCGASFSYSVFENFKRLLREEFYAGFC